MSRMPNVPLRKISAGGVVGLIADKAFMALVVALVGATVAFVTTVKSADISQSDKMKAFESLMYAMGAVVAAYIGGKSYENGKLNQNVVPEGFESATPPTVIVQTGAPGPAGPAGPQGVAGVSGPPGAVRSPMFAALVMIFLFCAGCAGTSEIFKRTVKPPIDTYASQTTLYIDEDTSLAPVLRDAAKAQVDAAKSAVDDVKKITVERVAETWPALRQRYLDYSTKLYGDDPLTVSGRARDVEQVDKLIAQEQQRKAQWFSLLGGGAK